MNPHIRVELIELGAAEIWLSPSHVIYVNASDLVEVSSACMQAWVDHLIAKGLARREEGDGA